MVAQRRLRTLSASAGSSTIDREQLEARARPKRDARWLKSVQVFLAGSPIRRPRSSAARACREARERSSADPSGQEERNRARQPVPAARFQPWWEGFRLIASWASPDRTSRGVVKASMRDGSEPSSTQMRWLIGRSWSSCTSPLGQRIEALAPGLFVCSQSEEHIFAVLRKESRSGLQRLRVWPPSSVSIVIPRQWRRDCSLLPRRRKAIDGGRFSMTFFKTRNCGPLRFFRNNSCRPS